MENPTIADLQRIFREVEKSSDDFILLENDANIAIQGIFVKEQKVSLSGVDSTKDWCIEKPVSGTEKYYVNVSSNDALVIFTNFLKGTEWNSLTSWNHLLEKEHFLPLTTTEKTALLKEIDFALTAIEDDDFKQFLSHQLKQEITQKQGVSKGSATVLEYYLEASSDPVLKNICLKCKNWHR